MTNNVEKSSAHVEIVPATCGHQPLLANLLELYIHDFSEFLDVELGPDGRFGYPPLHLYWNKPGRHPFLAQVDGKWAGFALVKKGSEISGNENVWDVAEFFVLRGYRRQGIGTQIAHQVWRRFPGMWEVRVLESNVNARDFWARAIATFIGREIHPVRVETGGKRWEVFAFESKRV